MNGKRHMNGRRRDNSGGVTRSRVVAAVAGAAAGFVNGFFGGGGGMILVPLLSRWGSIDARKLYATCIGVIFPVCAASAGVYLLRGGVSLATAAPYLFGGAIGGWLGGKSYGKIPVRFLRLFFAGFLLYAGVSYLR